MSESNEVPTTIEEPGSIVGVRWSDATDVTIAVTSDGENVLLSLKVEYAYENADFAELTVTSAGAMFRYTGGANVSEEVVAEIESYQ